MKLRAGESPNAASGEEKFLLPTHLKTDQLSQNFVSINNKLCWLLARLTYTSILKDKGSTFL
jgi:hypothetical protein